MERSWFLSHIIPLSHIMRPSIRLPIRSIDTPEYNGYESILATPGFSGTFCAVFVLTVRKSLQVSLSRNNQA